MKSQVNLFEFDYKDSREKYSPKELGGSTLQLAKKQGPLFCLLVKLNTAKSVWKSLSVQNGNFYSRNQW